MSATRSWDISHRSRGNHRYLKHTQLQDVSHVYVTENQPRIFDETSVRMDIRNWSLAYFFVCMCILHLNQSCRILTYLIFKVSIFPLDLIIQWWETKWICQFLQMVLMMVLMILLVTCIIKNMIRYLYYSSNRKKEKWKFTFSIKHAILRRHDKVQAWFPLFSVSWLNRL